MKPGAEDNGECKEPKMVDRNPAVNNSLVDESHGCPTFEGFLHFLRGTRPKVSRMLGQHYSARLRPPALS